MGPKLLTSNIWDFKAGDSVWIGGEGGVRFVADHPRAAGGDAAAGLLLSRRRNKTSCALTASEAVPLGEGRARQPLSRGVRGRDTDQKGALPGPLVLRSPHAGRAPPAPGPETAGAVGPREQRSAAAAPGPGRPRTSVPDLRVLTSRAPSPFATPPAGAPGPARLSRGGICAGPAAARSSACPPQTSCAAGPDAPSWSPGAARRRS